MRFLSLISIMSLIAYIPQYFIRSGQFRGDHKMAMRHGLAIGLAYAGVYHFITPNAFIFMMPDFLSAFALELVYISGVIEILAAVGLVIPAMWYMQWNLPNFRRWVGIGTAFLFAVLVIANVNVALVMVQAIGFESSIAEWTRVLFQPIYILWALYVCDVIFKHRSNGGN